MPSYGPIASYPTAAPDALAAGLVAEAEVCSELSVTAPQTAGLSVSGVESLGHQVTHMESI